MTLPEVLAAVLTEYNLSVEKHGDWQDYTLDQIMGVIQTEFMMEAAAAYNRGDLHGDHGVIRELSQVAACCIKTIVAVSGRPDASPGEYI
jgi:hypothetical protein